MANKEFAENLQKLIQERVGYGQQLTPVREAVWPNTNQVSEQPSQQEQQPEEEIVAATDDNAVGEISPQDDDQIPDMEIGGEILSLIISIGYILECNGIIDNKYDTAAVIQFLSENFMDTVNGEPIGNDDDVEVVAVDAVQEPTGPNSPGVVQQNTNPMEENKKHKSLSMACEESRKLMESRFKNFKKKDKKNA